MDNNNPPGIETNLNIDEPVGPSELDPFNRRQFLQQVLAVGGMLACGPTPLQAFAASPVPAPDPSIQRVLVMFKCHLDVGFSNTQANVIRKYFDVYYPHAMRVAVEMRQQGNDRYVWTTGSWLLYEYLEQASSEQRKLMDQAVARGDIAWHALPFNWQTEMMDRSMIQGSLGLSKHLDRRYGKTTCGAKMTDVPCHSRGLISPLAQGGVTFLDIGVNAASTAPQVPALFVWKNPAGESLTVMYHHRDYGGVVKVPDSNLAVAIMVRGDNSGPHTLQEISTIYADLHQQFPKAKVHAANLTEIAHAVEPASSKLPVVTSEIGDTWIYGVASDPTKVARYRELSRLRQRWIQEGKLSIGNGDDLALLASLLLVPEHTWGTDTKRYLDYDHYTPKQLAQVIDTPPYQTMITSWTEKRNNIDDAITSLPLPLRHAAQSQLAACKPSVPANQGLQVHKVEEEIHTPHFILALDPQTGAIRRLYDKNTNREWATAERPLGLFVYQTLSPEDYQKFFASYIVSTASWAQKDFGKPNANIFHPQSREWTPKLVRSWSGQGATGHRLLVHLRINDSSYEESGLVGWPADIYTEILLPQHEPIVNLQLSLFGKTANRLPEALWLSFMPFGTAENGWMLDKVNQPIDPLDVVAGGNRHMHAVSDFLHYKDEHGSFSMETLDAPLVALGERSSLYFSNVQPTMKDGIHVSLFNNAWGTNYPQWFGEAMRFRFNLRTA